MFFRLPDVIIFKCKVFKEYYKEIPLENIVYVSPKICIGGSAGAKSVVAHNTEVKSELFEVTKNNVYYSVKLFEGEKLLKFELQFPAQYLNKYVLVDSGKYDPSFEVEVKSLNQHLNLFKNTEGNVNCFVLRTNTAAETFSLGFHFFDLVDGNFPILEKGKINHVTTKAGISTAVILPAKNKESGANILPDLPPDNKYKFILVDDETYLFIFYEVTEQQQYDLNLISSYLSDFQPSVTVDLSYAYDFYSDDYLSQYIIFAKNIKTVIVQQDGVLIENELETTRPNTYDFYFDREYMKKPLTFIPVCNDEDGVMCQLTYPAPSESGYHFISYPNRDGISTTGTGFLKEVIYVEKGKSFNYYKKYKEHIKVDLEYKQTEPDTVVPKYESVEGDSNLKRVCLYVDEMIVPFSRKYYTENLNDLLEQLNIVIPEDDYSGIGSDKDGCITFLSSYLQPDAQITYLSSEVCDLPIVQIGTKPTPKPDPPVNPDPSLKNKYFCICSDESHCNECTTGIESNEIQKGEALSQDPGEGFEIRVFSDVSISSSVFKYDHNVVVDSKNNLILNDVKNIDLSDTTKLKADYLSFASCDNVVLKPKSTQFELKLSTVGLGKEFTIEIPSTLKSPLKLIISNSNENVIAPQMNVKGNGELNVFDYPIDKIKAEETVKVIEGVVLVCSPQEEGEKCDEKIYNDYKVLNQIEEIKEQLKKNIKICLFLNTKKGKYFDISIDMFNSQDLILIGKKAAAEVLLEEVEENTKLRVLSTTVLHNNEDEMKLEGSQGSATIDNDDLDLVVVGYNEQLLLTQDEQYNNQQPLITLQAMNENSKIILDDKIQIDLQNYSIETLKEKATIALYVGDKEIDQLPDNFASNENVQIEIKKGLPEQEPVKKGGGLSKGAIAGIVIAVIVVVAAVAAVLVYFFVIKKKKAVGNNSEDKSINENDSNNEDKSNNGDDTPNP